jgi:hypothetical protein
MKISVECYAGRHGDEEPSAFTRRRFVLRHDSRSGEWELAALVGQ